MATGIRERGSGITGQLAATGTLSTPAGWTGSPDARLANILAIAGSPSHPSRTYSLLEYAAQLQQEGIQAEILSVRNIPTL